MLVILYLMVGFLTILLLGAGMAGWVWFTIKDKDDNALLWSLLSIVLWPISMVIMGYRHRRWVMFGVGCMSLLGLIAGRIWMFSYRILAMMGYYEFVIGNVLWNNVPLLILLLAALILIAKRNRGWMGVCFHAYVGLMFLNWLAWSWVTQYFIFRSPTIKGWFDTLPWIHGLGLMLMGGAFLWTGYVLSDATMRRIFLWPLILWSMAWLLLEFLSLDVTYIVESVLGKVSNQQMFLMVSLVLMPVAILPSVILLIGVLRCPRREDEVTRPRGFPVVMEGEV